MIPKSVNPRAVEAALAYEWRTALQYLSRANGSRSQAYENLRTVLSVTPQAHERAVLLSVGAWMIRTWRLKRPVASETNAAAGSGEVKAAS